MNHFMQIHNSQRMLQVKQKGQPAVYYGVFGKTRGESDCARVACRAPASTLPYKRALSHPRIS